MRGIIRTLALGAVLAAGTTAAMAQGINNTGYDRAYYGAPGPNSTWYDRQAYRTYGYAPAPYAGVPYARAPNFGGGDSYGSSSRNSYAPGWWGDTYGPAQQAPWGYGGEYGYNAGFRSPSKY